MVRHFKEKPFPLAWVFLVSFFLSSCDSCSGTSSSTRPSQKSESKKSEKVETAPKASDANPTFQEPTSARDKPEPGPEVPSERGQGHGLKPAPQSDGHEPQPNGREFPRLNDQALTDDPPVHPDNPCYVRSTKWVESKKEERIYSHDDSNYHQFLSQMKISRSKAIKAWLLSTPTFGQFHSAQSLDLEPANKEVGIRNDGLFVVSLDVGHQKFVVKIGKDPDEADHLWRLERTIAFHPECLSKHDIDTDYVPSPQELTRLPKQTHLVEAGWYEGEKTFDNRGGKYQLLVLEKAEGEPLSEVSDEHMVAAYEHFGESTGAFHFLFARAHSSSFSKLITWRHGDLHAGNVFFDVPSGSITFIDAGGMDGHSPFRDPAPIRDLVGNEIRKDFSYDLDQAVVSPLRKRIHSAEGDITAASLIALHVVGGNQVGLNTVHRGELYLELQKYSLRHQAFVQGYLRNFPDSMKPEIKTYFKNSCESALDSVLKDYKKWGTGGPNLENNVRKELPEPLRDCLEGNFETSSHRNPASKNKVK